MPRSIVFIVFAVVSVTADWELVEDSIVGLDKSLLTVHRSTAFDLSECRSLAEELGRSAVLHHFESKLCVVFREGKDVVDDTRANKANFTVSYFFEQQEEGLNYSLSGGEVVATIVLAIFYSLCLGTLAFTCRHKETDIAAQVAPSREKEACPR
ncbi:hypothetical protein DIPPA_32717 [Diplonema papillatum]|nr:hypothetical protein DIPPA_32717 [Diplonema papillatum]